MGFASLYEDIIERSEQNRADIHSLLDAKKSDVFSIRKLKNAVRADVVILEDALTKAQPILQKLRTPKAQIAYKLQEKHGELDALRGEYEGKLKEYKSENAELKRDLTMAKRDLTVAVRDLALQKEEMERKLDEQRHSLLQRCSQSEEDHNVTERKLREVVTERDNLKQEARELRQLKQKGNENFRLRKKIENLQEQLRECNKRARRTQEENDELVTNVETALRGSPLRDEILGPHIRP